MSQGQKSTLLSTTKNRRGIAETRERRNHYQSRLERVGTPVVAVPKANRLVRLCGDFNPELKVDQYPLPRIEDIVANLAAGEKFIKIDLRQAYLQLETEEESKKYLTINTHKGLYQYNRLLLGVASAPAIWQRTIDQILQNSPGTQMILDEAHRELG